MSRSGSFSETQSLIPASEQKRFPFSVFFILGNEFCERYSFYGMRTILVLYLNYYLRWDADTSTAVYHAFTVLAYLFPLFGAILADGWWGKYKTILWLSAIYAVGMGINTLGAIGTLGNLTVHAVLSSIGLFVIAFGTGGIKPCVSAFGGDQFDVDQAEARGKFFSLFYFAINAGSLLSTFLSPLIRENVKCFGDDCYALAFGIPAILMAIALTLFIVGTKWYKRNPPTGNIFAEVCKAIGSAIKNRWNTPKNDRTKEHWMDYAMTPTNQVLIRDIKYVLHILILFIPLPLFWTLFDQQGSRWTLQAVKMNGYVGSIRILPDQMQICNPLFIILLIPISEALIYPCLRKINVDFTPLRRMAAGMIFAGLAFIVAALVQMKIDVNMTLVPQSSSQTSLRVINAANCPLVVNSTIYPDWKMKNESLTSGGIVLLPGNVSDTASRFVRPEKYMVHFKCLNMKSFANTVSVTLQGKTAFDLIVSEDRNNNLQSLFKPHETKKSDDGNAIVGVINAFDNDVEVNGKKIFYNGNETLPPMMKGSYNLTITANGENYTRKYTVDTGGIYTLVIRGYAEHVLMDSYTDVNPNDVNIFWIIPQYFLITLGEIFLSITGLSFSYSQAPPSMKSVLTSFWLLTISIGNVIVLIVAEARLIPKQADEYILFSGLIGVAVIVFIVLAMRYKYIDEDEFTMNSNNSNQEETKHEDESSS